MTIRDLLSLNDAWFNDYIEIKKDCETILKLISISELHPVWLNYEIKAYYLLPHVEDEDGIEKRVSTVNCDFIITIDRFTLFQQKTNLDEALNERIKENESTNNN